MPEQDKVAVTYIGRQENYVDRIYRTNLAFTPGQSRALPAGLAARFLRHGDSFERTKVEAPEEDPAKKVPEDGKKLEDDTAKKVPEDDKELEDDTAEKLAESEKKAKEEREKEERLFAVQGQIDSMDKDAVRDFLDRHFGEKPHINTGLPKLQALARDLVATRGLP